MNAIALTVREVAARLRVSEETVLAHIHANRLRASNISCGSCRPRWRISEAALADLLAARSAPTPAARRRKRQTAMTEYF
jgi:excisionase family DNA binding protein